MTLSAGAQLGHYEIIAPLGAGGMGEVYRACDTRLKRDVALKVLPRAFAADPDRMMRFQREAEVLASLNHSNIAHIYGVEDRALVMELVEGESPQGPLPFPEAWKIASQIADALEYAHEKSVIHRDLKPANVKVTPEGVVKLLDFGLAKAFSATADAAPSDPSNSPTITMGATVAGTIMGTAAYMAPEQARGKKVDKRADIWSWGIVLYELLTGERLFQGEDVAETLAAVIHKEPDLTRVPPEARRLLRRCLEKDPKKRLRDIGDAGELLDLETGAEASPQASSRETPTGWIATAAVATTVAVAALSLAAWVWLRPAPLPEVTRFQIYAPPGSTLPLGTPAPSPDGRMIAYTVRGQDGIVRIHVRPMDSTESRVLPGTENAAHPFWSPDGRSLAFAADGALKRIDLAGGSARILASTTGPWHGSWSQAGIILYAAPGAPAQIPAEGGASTPGFDLDEKKNETGGGFPFFLSDGKRFLLEMGHSDGSGTIELALLGSMQRTVVLSDVASAPILAPAPNGKVYLLYLRDASLMAQEFDEKAEVVRGSPFLLVDGIGRVAARLIRPSVGVSPSGILAYQTGSDTGNVRLGWFDRSGKALSQIPSAAGGVRPNLSPDGRFVAIEKRSETGSDIWIVDLARGSATRLTFGGNGKSYANPIWSPDGKRVAYSLLGGGMYVKDANGTGAEQTLLKSAIELYSWSSDGRQILFRSGRLFLLPLDGGKAPVPIGGSAQNVGDGADISPDGKYFAFFSSESGRAEVYVEAMPPGTGKWQISINGGRQPRWRKDGKELFFRSSDGKMMAVDIQTSPSVTAGIPHALFQASTLSGLSYDVSPDGQRFLIAALTSSAVDAPITVVLNWWAGLKK